MSAVLRRETFETSRKLDFCNEKQLTIETGHPKEEWPLVILKELVDNALDTCEEAGIPPEIDISVLTGSLSGAGEIVITDNGPGIPPEVVEKILNFNIRVSSREAYVSPTRGAQGNALKTVVPMPYVLDGKRGVTCIAAKGVAHIITFRVDQLRQEPALKHDHIGSPRTNGTRIAIEWPDSACSILVDAKSRFLQIAEDFAWINPHLRIRVEWDRKVEVDRRPSNPDWKKWLPSDPTSAHWYDAYRFERYIAAHVARDRDLGRIRLVREFIEEIRGFSGSAKQQIVLAQCGVVRAPLSSFFTNSGEPDRDGIAQLLASLREHSKQVKPQGLGMIGKEHLLACFTEAGGHPNSFKYKKVLSSNADGLPYVIETAFGYCPDELRRRRIVTGANWSIGINNPFRSFGTEGEGLESLLAELRARANEPIIVVAHLARPRLEYTDRGKSAIVIKGGDDGVA